MAPMNDPQGLSAAKRALLERWSRGQGAPAVARIPRLRADAERLLSLQQQRLWFLEQLEPGRSAHHLWACLQIDAAIDLAKLQAAADRLVARHDALRTAIGGRVTAPRLVEAQASMRVSFTDLQGHAGDRYAEALVRARQEAARPFELGVGPLWRAHVYRLSPEQHLLLIAVHHLVGDGWSLGVIMRELPILYGGGSLPPPTVDYADFAAWQRQRTDWGPRVEHWKNVLAGELPVLELPTDHARPARRLGRAGFHAFTVAAVLAERLRALARVQGATPFHVLLAGFEVFLHRHSGQEEVLIGAPSAGRDAETDGIVGVFVNTLVFRSRMEPQSSFLEHLARVRAEAVEATSRQDVPFEKIVEALRPKRDLSRPPIFQAMFDMFNFPMPAAKTGPLPMRPISMDGGSALFDLSLFIDDSRPEMVASFGYDAALFDESTIVRFAQRFTGLLEGIVEAPDRVLAELPMITEAERQEVLVGYNSTEEAYDSSACIHDLFARQAKLTPDAIAVVSERGALDYRSLRARSLALARRLTELGVRRGDRVAVATDRSAELLVALLAVMETGAAYVPIDPAYPADRVRWMLEDSGARVLVTTADVAPLLPPFDGKLVLTHETSTEPVPDRAQPQDRAYVIYTSGSTGRPKGVEVPHRAVVALLSSIAKKTRIGPTDVWLAVTTISFDIAALELFGPLMAGAAVVFASREDAVDGVRLARRIETSGATVMQATPSAWRLLLQAGWKGAPGLRVLCGGEALPLDLAQRLTQICAEVWNMYGPTETTIWSLCERLVPPIDRVTIGRPIGNTRAYVLEPSGALAPIGVAGELFIGGAGVARGYFQRPDLTAERFVPDLAGPTDDARMYRTGDLARFLPDGRVEFLGRLDHQIKLRGHRIELAEIEAAILSDASVREAVVVLREGAGQDPRLVAYAVTDAPAHEVEPRLRAILKARLPAVMVPADWVWLGGLPLTPNGKIDRRALPDPTVVPSHRPRVPPSTDTERAIAEIWSEVLGVERFGVEDNFFDVGGHSLLVLRVQQAIEDRLGRAIEVIRLFEHTTVRALAAHLDTSEEASSSEIDARVDARLSARDRARARRG